MAFTNLPYIPDAGSYDCGAGLVNYARDARRATTAASHEYAETLTDQFPETTPPGGWTDASGEETADKCAYLAAPAVGHVFDLVLATGPSPSRDVVQPGGRRQGVVLRR